MSMLRLTFIRDSVKVQLWVYICSLESLYKLYKPNYKIKSMLVGHEEIICSAYQCSLQYHEVTKSIMLLLPCLFLFV